MWPTLIHRALWNRSGPRETSSGRTPQVRARHLAPPAGAEVSAMGERAPLTTAGNPSRLPGSARRRIDPPKRWNPSRR